MSEDAPEVTKESTKKPARAKLETIVNCSKSEGAITRLDGSRCLVGETADFSTAVCERLVLAGVARYPAKSDSQ